LQPEAKAANYCIACSVLYTVCTRHCVLDVLACVLPAPGQEPEVGGPGYQVLAADGANQLLLLVPPPAAPLLPTFGATQPSTVRLRTRSGGMLAPLQLDGATSPEAGASRPPESLTPTTYCDKCECNCDKHCNKCGFSFEPTSFVDNGVLYECEICDCCNACGAVCCEDPYPCPCKT
jgi:hypothetical protein